MTNTFFIFLTACLLLNCAGRQKPVPSGDSATETQPAAPLTPVASVINIPTQIKMSFIENAVNEQVRGIIYKDNAFPVDPIGTAQLTVRKNGRISIRAAGNELIYKIPLKISMRFSLSLLGHTEHKDVDAGITVNLRSKYTLQNNWHLKTTTTVDGYEWTTPPTVKIRFITIPIKPVADILVSRQSGVIKELGGIIDKSMSNTVNVKTMISPLWEKIQTPAEITLPDMPQSMWLRFNPTDIYITQISGQGGFINAMTGIRAAAETFIGDKPKAHALKPLPDFKTSENQDSTFTINLYSEIPFKQATAICREIFVGKTFKSGIQKVTVHDIEVSGANGMAKVRMEMSGSIKGTVNVTGRAVFNQKTRTLSLDDFDFDVETASRYQQAKNWLLRGVIMSKMKPLMKFPLGDTLDNAKALMQKMLSDYELYEGTVLNGQVAALSVRGVNVTDEGFRAVVTARGAASIKVLK